MKISIGSFAMGWKEVISLDIISVVYEGDNVVLLNNDRKKRAIRLDLADEEILVFKKIFSE